MKAAVWNSEREALEILQIFKKEMQEFKKKVSLLSFFVPAIQI